jgi:ribosomal protein S19E (S16A)
MQSSANDKGHRAALVHGISLKQSERAVLHSIAANCAHVAADRAAMDEIERLGLVRPVHLGFVVTPRGAAFLTDETADTQLQARPPVKS